MGSNKQTIVNCEDTCFECKNFKLCYMRRNMENLFRSGTNILNIDSTSRPGKYIDFFNLLAASCLEFNKSI